MTHKPNYRCYKQNGGKHNLVESICCERYEFRVKYIVKTLSDSIVENIFDEHYHVDKGSDYELMISALAMKNVSRFNKSNAKTTLPTLSRHFL